MILLQLHQQFADFRGQFGSPLLPPCWDSSCLSGWLFRAGCHHPFSRARKTCQLTPHTGPPHQLCDEHSVEKLKESKSQKTEHREDTQFGERTKVHKDPGLPRQNSGQRGTVWIQSWEHRQGKPRMRGIHTTWPVLSNMSVSWKTKLGNGFGLKEPKESDN